MLKLPRAQPGSHCPQPRRFLSAGAWSQTWLCCEVHGWSELARSGERLGTFTKECERGEEGAVGIGWVHILLVSSEVLPTTEDSTLGLGNSAHGHRSPWQVSGKGVIFP